MADHLRDHSRVTVSLCGATLSITARWSSATAALLSRHGALRLASRDASSRSTTASSGGPVIQPAISARWRRRADPPLQPYPTTHMRAKASSAGTATAEHASIRT
jgi:hypothetical protein